MCQPMAPITATFRGKYLKTLFLMVNVHLKLMGTLAEQTFVFLKSFATQISIEFFFNT